MSRRLGILTLKKFIFFIHNPHFLMYNHHTLSDAKVMTFQYSSRLLHKYYTRTLRLFVLWDDGFFLHNRNNIRFYPSLSLFWKTTPSDHCVCRWFKMSYFVSELEFKIKGIPSLPPITIIFEFGDLANASVAAIPFHFNKFSLIPSVTMS